MSAESTTVVINIGHEYQDPREPIDMRHRFFRLLGEPDPETLRTISSMVIQPEIEVLSGDGYVDIRVTLDSPNAWQEGGTVNNSQFIYDALRLGVQAHV